MVEITLQLRLTDQQYKYFNSWAEYSHVPVERLLMDFAQYSFPAFFGQMPDISSLSDDRLLELARATMPDDQDERKAELSQQTALTLAEQQELYQLQVNYWVGQFTKTEAMIEAKKRGLL